MTENVLQLTKDIEDSKQDIEHLDKNIDRIVKKAKNVVADATKQATDDAVNEYTTDLHDKKREYTADMDKVFSGNMGLMQDLCVTFNLNTTVNESTTKSITSINVRQQPSPASNMIIHLSPN